MSLGTAIWMVGLQLFLPRTACGGSKFHTLDMHPRCVSHKHHSSTKHWQPLTSPPTITGHASQLYLPGDPKLPIQLKRPTSLKHNAIHLKSALCPSSFKPAIRANRMQAWIIQYIRFFPLPSWASLFSKETAHQNTPTVEVPWCTTSQPTSGFPPTDPIDDLRLEAENAVVPIDFVALQLLTNLLGASQRVPGSWIHEKNEQSTAPKKNGLCHHSWVIY